MLNGTTPLVLMRDVLLMPASELARDQLEQFDVNPGDLAITRTRSREPSMVVDASGATFLRLFDSPCTIVDAVLAFSRSQATDPERTMQEVYPLIRRFVRSRVLIAASEHETHASETMLAAGDEILSWSVLEVLQVLDDTELYQVRDRDGTLLALKIASSAYARPMERTLEREAAILTRLHGGVSPRLLARGVHDERPFLAIEWLPGVDAAQAAAELCSQPPQERRVRLIALCSSILKSYGHLHRQGVIHADVHPRNVLVASDGSVRLIDFGLARLLSSDSLADRVPRAGIAYFFEPEYATALIDCVTPPASTFAGEQYALAALLYYLIGERHYVNFSVEKRAMLEQISHAAPRSLTDADTGPWPGIEKVLFRALQKEPASRYVGVAEFTAAFAVAAKADLAIAMPAQTDRQPAGAWRERYLQSYLSRFALPDADTHSPALSPPFCSVSFGAAGVAYALYRVAVTRGDAALLSTADYWATWALHNIAANEAFRSDLLKITPEVIGQVSPYHCPSGIHAVRALISHAVGDIESQRTAIAAFAAATRDPCRNADLTLGKAGVLLVSSMLLDTAPSDRELHVFGDALMRDLWTEVNAVSSIGDEGDVLDYFGMAHGWAGVLQALLRWCRSTHATPPATLRTRLDELAVLATPAGRGRHWPISRASADHMAGWCHGAAGYVHLWLAAYEHYGDEGYLRLAELASWSAWEAPHVNGSLCCGSCGRAYALLELYKSSGERVWLERAISLADHSLTSTIGPEYPPASLYKGGLGAAMLVADLTRANDACMPFFGREGWS